MVLRKSLFSILPRAAAAPETGVGGSGDSAAHHDDVEMPCHDRISADGLAAAEAE